MVKAILGSVKYFKKDIFKVFSFTAISTLIKMFTGLISVKIVAVIIGPSGIALIGQLNNFVTILMILASGGINNGVTKYIAELKTSDLEVRQLLSSSLKITLICSLTCGLLIVIFNAQLSRVIMLNEDYSYLFVIFGLTVFLYALNSLISSILNGYKAFKLYVSVSIVGSILGLFFTLLLVYFWKLQGALLAIITFQSTMFFVSMWMIRKLPWVTIDFFKNKIDRVSLKRLGKFSLMTLITASTGPILQLILRGYVISNISTVDAGWWEAMNRISNMYLLVITTSFSVYYLPRLSEIDNNIDLRREIFNAYKIILPILFVSFFAIYLCRILIIKILFTSQFLGMESLFFYQLVGDFFKIASCL